MTSLHARLMECGRGDPFDRHVFACAIVAGWAETLTRGLGLAPTAVSDLVDRYFPGAERHLPVDVWGDGAGEDQLEEPDLRRLLLDHRSSGAREEEWLAAIVARRSLGPNHLWQDLGLFGRDELNRLMDRHFRRLKRLNSGDMKWKKFFYRQLCERDGVAVCRAPTCDACVDIGLCFGPEAGEPLSVLQRDVLDVRQSRRRF
ncbi:MAG: nitrogen fixation protein NifQ [Rhodospirillales bacterium]